jgi:hypothetical protein
VPLNIDRTVVRLIHSTYLADGRKHHART